MLMDVLLWSTGRGVAGFDRFWLVLAGLLGVSHWASASVATYQNGDRLTGAGAPSTPSTRYKAAAPPERPRPPGSRSRSGGPAPPRIRTVAASGGRIPGKRERLYKVRAA
jgi:hypothetical protein